MNNYEYHNFLFPCTLEKEGEFKIPGFRRGVWMTHQIFGYSIKNVSTENQFRFVVHSSLHQTFVEIFTYDFESSKSVPVSPDLIRKFTKGSGYERYFVERDGHALISGLRDTCLDTRPSYGMCMASNAKYLVADHGDALAALVRFPNRINTFSEAVSVDEDLRKVGQFVDEMEKEYAPLKRNIFRCEQSISKWMLEIDKVDKDMCEAHEKYRHVMSVLSQYGLTLEGKLKQI